MHRHRQNVHENAQKMHTRYNAVHSARCITQITSCITSYPTTIKFHKNLFSQQVKSEQCNSRHVSTLDSFFL